MAGDVPRHKRLAEYQRGLGRAAPSGSRDPERAHHRSGAPRARTAMRRRESAAGSWHDAPALMAAGRKARWHGGMPSDRMTVNGIELEVLRRGASASRPVLLLHGMDTVPPNARFLDLLGQHAEIIAPSSPGFGNTQRPADFDTIYDLVHLYLALHRRTAVRKVALLGLSFGGWLAAEIAVALQPPQLRRLILVDPLGIKLGDRESRDILDVFNVNPAEVRRCSWHDPKKAPITTR